MQFTVDLAQFRAALASVKPHVSTDKKDVQSRCVVVSLVDGQSVLVTASNGLTSAVAQVPFSDNHVRDGEVGYFTLTPETCKTLIDMFTQGKDDPDADMSVEVRFTKDTGFGSQKDTTVATITFRRLGQLFGGDQLRITEPVQSRDVSGLWATISTAAARQESKLVPVKVDVNRLAHFKAAETVYNSPLTVMADGPGANGILIFCGDHFAGWLAVDRVDMDKASERRNQERRDHWGRTLPAGLKAV